MARLPLFSDFGFATDPSPPLILYSSSLSIVGEPPVVRLCVQGWTSLFVAALKGHVAVVAALLGAGANPRICPTAGKHVRHSIPLSAGSRQLRSLFPHHIWPLALLCAMWAQRESLRHRSARVPVRFVTHTNLRLATARPRPTRHIADN